MYRIVQTSVATEDTLRILSDASRVPYHYGIITVTDCQGDGCVAFTQRSLYE